LIALHSQAQPKASHVNKFAEVAWSLSVCFYAAVPAEIAEAIVDLEPRRVVAGIAAREGLTATTESARKWRRNGLKRLNPGSEMVVARKPRAHKIWYTGARLTAPSD
jgi:uncharacterized protein (TIGR04206 family)